MPESELKTLAEVVGENARRLRLELGLTTAAVAWDARGFGLRKWTDARVSDLEHGRVSPTIPTLYALSLTFAYLSKRDVGLADLVGHDGDVELTDTLTVPGRDLVKFVAGSKISADAVKGTARRRVVQQLLGESYDGAGIRQVVGDAERKAAKSSGIDAEEFSRSAVELWGRTFTEERDRRAGPSANPQKRGRISRDLIAEIRGYRHGND